MFSIGDVLYIKGIHSHDAIVIITSITYGECYIKDSIQSDGDAFYHVKVLEGDYYDWFMEDSPIYMNCLLMVSNLNESERLAIML